MRRSFYFVICFLVTVFCLTLVLTSMFSSEASGKKKKKAQKTTITVRPFGPTQEQLDNASERVLNSANVQKLLGGTKYRQMSFGTVDPESKNGERVPPTGVRGVYYDYTNNRAVIAEGMMSDLTNVTVTESFEQPHADPAEFEEAVRILKADKEFAAKIQSKSLSVYEPMPPVLYPSKTGERVERTVNVGLISGDKTETSEIVGVNMIRGTIVRYENNAPPTSMATEGSCGIPSGTGGSTSNGTPGQYQVQVTQGPTMIWEYLVIRPSASSGRTSERSGIEIRDVKYKGKMVLKRGHAPILNVQYLPLPGQGSCGPYRDWQYQEGAFQTPTGSTDVADGIRMCPSPATTALDTGNDSGNFRGVAIYTQNDETVMVSEMNAGWYRYIMEWRLGNDGRIRPRYGFGATNNSCVCIRHHHHVYWRFDFDVVNANNKIFRTEIPKKLSDRGGWQLIPNEVHINRSYHTKRSLIIKNGSGNEAYAFYPNVTDGFTDTYGHGDIWVLRYQESGGVPTELDDPNTSTAANINPWLTNESIDNQDLVIWYAGHFMHEDGNNLLSPDRNGEVLTGSHVIGPDLIPMNW